jgi:hypothetical protein
MEFWIRDMQNVLFFTVTLKAYENSQSSVKVGIKSFKYKRWVLFVITVLHVHLTSTVQYVTPRTILKKKN